MEANRVTQMKACPHCGPDLIPISRFSKNKSREDGYQDYCRVAQRVYNANNRRKNGAKVGLNTEAKIRAIVTTSTYFRCVKMGNAVISILVCLKRLKEKGSKIRIRGIPATDNNMVPHYQCLDCLEGKELKERIRALL